ncbi:PKD domain-containing protein [Candidatus Woesearchaeota archaeon]|nr:PKD domain-containing protein [Candidatus Woesearchaeota archaeon]
MRKAILLTLFVLLLTISFQSAEAALTAGFWLDDQGNYLQNKSMVLLDGESADFNWSIFSMNAPTTYEVELLDDGDQVVHTFASGTDSGDEFGVSYLEEMETVDQSIYSEYSNYRVRIYAADAYSAYSEYLILTVIEINVAPVVEVIPDQTWSEDDQHTINLNAYFSDANDDVLTYTHTPLSNTGVDIFDNNMTFSPDNDWFGSETITITASDGKFNVTSNQFLLTVNSVNDAPVVSDIPDQTNDYGVPFNIFDLDDYVTDVDHSDSEITWTFSGNNFIDVQIGLGRVVTLTPTVDWWGSETIRFTASDLGDSSDFDSMTATVNMPTNPPTVIITQPRDGDGFTAGKDIQFIAFGEDLDLQTLSYEWDFGDGSTGIESVAYHSYETPGTYTIGVEVSDTTNLTDTDSIQINVYEHGYNISDLNSYEDDQYSVQNSDFFRGMQLYVGFEVYSLLNGSFAPNQINTVRIYNAETGLGDMDLLAYNGTVGGTQVVDGQPATPDGNYYYSLPSIPLDDYLLGNSMVFVFTFKDDAADHAYLAVTVLNNELELLDMSDILMSQNQQVSWDLDDYVTDLETPDDEIAWSFAGNTNVGVSIDAATNIVTITSSDWVGNETVTFTADDTDGSVATDDVAIEVITNTAPVWTTDIPDANLAEDFGSTILVSGLASMVTDSDNDTISFVVISENTAQVDCEVSGNDLILNSVSDWNGLSSCTIGADDGQGWVTPNTFSITVNGVNDAPSMQAISDQNAVEDSTFTYQVVCTDPDGDTLTYTDDTVLFDIDSTGYISFTPTLNDEGVYDINITCSDSALLVSDVFTLTVDSLPRRPVITPSVQRFTAYVDKAFTFQVEVEDLNNDILTFSDDSNLFDIDPATGVIYFIPAVSQFALRHTFTVFVSDGVFTEEETFSLIILFYNPAHCSDGLDNDNDGLTDYPEDPGCDSPEDKDEFSIVNNVEKGIKISKVRAFGYDYNSALAGDYLMISATLKNYIDEDIDSLTVGAIMPELGIKEPLGVVDVDAGEKKTVKSYLYIPHDVEPGDYYLGIYVSNSDLKRTKYLPLRIR